MKIWIGIDPGMKGGIARIDEDGGIQCYEMFTTGGEIDGAEIGIVLRAAKTNSLGQLYVVVERAQAMPKQGVTSMFKYGVGYGKILGIIESLGIPHETVQPARWKAAVFAGSDWKSKGKEPSINFCRMQYPGVDLVMPRCRKAHDGMADALCLAHYGRMQRG